MLTAEVVWRFFSESFRATFVLFSSKTEQPSTFRKYSRKFGAWIRSFRMASDRKRHVGCGPFFLFVFTLWVWNRSLQSSVTLIVKLCEESAQSMICDDVDVPCYNFLGIVFHKAAFTTWGFRVQFDGNQFIGTVLVYQRMNMLSIDNF